MTTQPQQPDETGSTDESSGDSDDDRGTGSAGTGDASTASDRAEGRVIVETTPTIKPLVARLALTVLIGVVAIALFYANPELLGSVEVTNVALIVVQLVVIVAVVRLLVQIVIYRRTRYVLTDRVVRREYSLLARSKAREVPYDLVRSHQRTQSRIEYFLGIGSIALNQGLGDLTLTYVPDHVEVYEEIRKRVEA